MIKTKYVEAFLNKACKKRDRTKFCSSDSIRKSREVFQKGCQSSNSFSRNASSLLPGFASVLDSPWNFSTSNSVRCIKLEHRPNALFAGFLSQANPRSLYNSKNTFVTKLPSFSMDWQRVDWCGWGDRHEDLSCISVSSILNPDAIFLHGASEKFIR